MATTLPTGTFSSFGINASMPAASWTEIDAEDLITMGTFIVIGVPVALGLAIAFPISTDTAVLWLAQFGG
jgi:uncharacterized membrane protein